MHCYCTSAIITDHLLIPPRKIHLGAQRTGLACRVHAVGYPNSRTYELPVQGARSDFASWNQRFDHSEESQKASTLGTAEAFRIKLYISLHESLVDPVGVTKLLSHGNMDANGKHHTSTHQGCIVMGSLSINLYASRASVHSRFEVQAGIIGDYPGK